MVMGLLTIALLIPLAWVSSIVSERANRRDIAVAEIGTTWGGPQTLGGLVLSVPYVATWTETTGREQRIVGRAQFLPRDLQIEGALKTDTRKRGIFRVVVYSTELRVTGKFVKPDLDWIRPRVSEVDWSQASVNIGVSDPRGLTQRMTLRWGTQDLPLAGGVAPVGLFSSGVRAAVPGLAAAAPGSEIPFACTIPLNGTRDLMFLPGAEETVVSLTSPWPDPSFNGGPHPTYTIDGSGFSARWRAADISRPFPSRWTTTDTASEQLASTARLASFGVSLVQMVDIYQQSERAVKYAVLFIVLTFLVFFLWEVFHAALLHPVQYAFVGFALCLFYLLLVSLSERAGFDVAYGLSATVTTLLISGYARGVLGGTRQSATVLAALAGLYGFLYLLLRLEDFALLAGSIGLFIVLAWVMYITRRMNWYELRLGSSSS
jgi:inner membrane protein